MAVIQLSKTLIIVIAVSGFVGCVIILLLVFKCCRRPKSAPLPPIQPLAHHREKEPKYLPHPHVARNSARFSQIGRFESNASLLKQSREPSFHTDDSHGTPSSSHHSFSVFPSPSINVSHQSSPLSVGSHSDEPAVITQQYVFTTRTARSSSRTRLRPSRSRETSLASTYNISARPPTRSLSGVPHPTLSNFQIVLPTPLAPQLRIATNSTVGSYEDLVERRGIADGWTTAPGRITSRCSNSDQDLLTQDASRGRKTSSSAGHQYRRSLDTTDQPGRSESQTQYRGRSSSSRFTHADSAPSPRPVDNQSPGAIPQKSRAGQAEQLPSRKLSRSSSRVKANSRSRSRSIPRSHLSPNDTPNIPFPQSVPHSSYTPSSSADTLARHPTSNNLSPPVPPLPQLPHSSLMQAEHTQSTHAINHSTSNAFNPMAQEP